MKHTVRNGSLLLFCCLLLSQAALPDEIFGQLLIRNKIMKFDTTLCGTKKCMTLILKDTGKTAITINTHDAFFTPFASDTPFVYPQTLNPGDSIIYDICYSPTSAGSFDT